MPIDMKTMPDHPAKVLDDLAADAEKVGVHDLAIDMRVAAGSLRSFEAVSGLIFAALDNDGLERVREAHAEFDHRDIDSIAEFHSAVIDLLGLE